MIAQNIAVPSLVRMKPGALDRLGIYLARGSHQQIALLFSEGLVTELVDRAESSLSAHGIEVVTRAAIEEASFEQAARHFAGFAPQIRAVVGLGGGRALDTAKYIAFLGSRPYFAVPTSLSNDGFCSPQSSLSLQSRRRSLPARLPVGVIVDTEVCLQAPKSLWLSGVGDLVAKITAVEDWKRAFHARGEPVNDLAALLSDATVRQFMNRPSHDLEGMRLLGTSLMLNGIAMEICGSSRPASGSEHLISHALDQCGTRPHLHGLQVGMAAYLVAQLQGQDPERIGGVFDSTGFWDEIRSAPFSREQWFEAVRIAPTIKQQFHTVLSERDCLPEVARLIDQDRRLAGCFCD